MSEWDSNNENLLQLQIILISDMLLQRMHFVILQFYGMIENWGGKHMRCQFYYILSIIAHVDFREMTQYKKFGMTTA